MANDQLSVNIATSKLSPIFADNTAMAVRVKASKNSAGEVEKEVQLEIIFLDMLTQQPVGRFVMGRLTARELINGLAQNMAKLEKEIASKDMPKPQEIAPTSSSKYW